MKTCGECAWFKRFERSKELVAMGIEEQAPYGRCEAPIKVPSQCVSCLKVTVENNMEMYNCDYCGKRCKASADGFYNMDGPACMSWAEVRASVAAVRPR